MENIGTRLRALREEKKESQKALATIAGVTKQAISKIETKGVIESSGSTLEPIARHYGVNLRWLLTGEGQKHRQSAPESQSHAQRFDPDMLALTHRALREMYRDELRRPYNLEDDPARFLKVYEFQATLSQALPVADLIQVIKTAWLEQIKGAVEDGQSGEGANRMPVESVHKGDLAGRIQRKKSGPKNR